MVTTGTIYHTLHWYCGMHWYDLPAVTVFRIPGSHLPSGYVIERIIRDVENGFNSWARLAQIVHVFHFVLNLASQDVLKTDVKKSQICPILCQSDPL